MVVCKIFYSRVVIPRWTLLKEHPGLGTQRTIEGTGWIYSLTVSSGPPKTGVGTHLMMTGVIMILRHPPKEKVTRTVFFF